MTSYYISLGQPDQQKFASYAPVTGYAGINKWRDQCTNSFSSSNCVKFVNYTFSIMACKASLELEDHAQMLRKTTLQDGSDQTVTGDILAAAPRSCEGFNHNPTLISSKRERLMRKWSETLTITTNEDEDRGRLKERSAKSPRTPVLP